MPFKILWSNTQFSLSSCSASTLFRLRRMRVAVWKNLVFLPPNRSHWILDFCIQIISSSRRVPFSSIRSFSSNFSNPGLMNSESRLYTPSSLVRSLRLQWNTLPNTLYSSSVRLGIEKISSWGHPSENTSYLEPNAQRHMIYPCGLKFERLLPMSTIPIPRDLQQNGSMIRVRVWQVA